MSGDKRRSKSIGRSPSRSFDLSKFLKHKKKDNLNVNDSDDETFIHKQKDNLEWTEKMDKLMEKMTILGDLTTELDKQKIDGGSLHKIMQDLFKQYTNDKDNTSEKFLMLNSSRNHKDLLPPSNLKKSTKKVDLEKVTKLQRIFNNIPIFSNEKNYTIRELLTGINNIVENLGIDLSESEYELILNQKLSPRVKSAVRGYKHDSLKALFTNLLNIYDSSENHHEAFSALVNQKCKFSCLHEFMEETLRLLSLSRKNDDQQSQLFVHSVEHVVPKRVFEKLMDFIDSYEILKEGKYPPLPVLVDYVYKHRTEIDAHMAKCFKGNKYNFAVSNDYESEGEVERDNMVLPMACKTCNRNNHTTENCFKTATCENCNMKGHVEKYCRQTKRCKKCGKTNHITSNCFSRCRLCNSPNHNSVRCDVYQGIEPAQTPCSKCQEKLFIKIYHPRALCKTSPKN